MNLVLFTEVETTHPLPRNDPRACHVLDVLKRTIAQDFDCGLVNGLRGKAVIRAIDAAAFHLEFNWGVQPPALPAITLLVGLPRPQTAKKVLSEVTTLGVSAILFFRADKSEPSYASSSLWQGDEVRKHLVAAAGQAFCTRIPRVIIGGPLEEALREIPQTASRLALDNYEAHAPLPAARMSAPVVLAVGSERGWSARERDVLRASGFELTHLGQRVLRTETACVAGVTLVLAALGLFQTRA